MEFSECSEFSENRPPVRPESRPPESQTADKPQHKRKPTAFRDFVRIMKIKMSQFAPLQAGELQAVELPGLQAGELQAAELQACELHKKGEQQWIRKLE